MFFLNEMYHAIFTSSVLALKKKTFLPKFCTHYCFSNARISTSAAL